MLEKVKIIDRIAFVTWSFFSYLFFGFSILVFLFFLFNGKYNPELEPGRYLKIWEVLWDIRGLVIAPAPFLLLGLLFRRFGSQSKSSDQAGKSVSNAVGK